MVAMIFVRRAMGATLPAVGDAPGDACASRGA